MLPPIILSIAGSDCSGGAGIQADIKTISALGGYAASVITAVTAQNTLGVQSVYPIPADMVKAQITSVMDDLRPDAVKIGMVYDAGIVTAIVDCLQTYTPECIVYDPVMISTSGRRLMTEETIQVIKTELFPLCTLITPNLNEASLLWGQTITGTVEMRQAAQELSCRYNTAILVKGGHLDGDVAVDVLFADGELREYSSRRVVSVNTHGTGCTLSSAVASFLALGLPLAEAVGCAKNYLHSALVAGANVAVGGGHGPVNHLFNPNKLKTI